MFLVLVLSLGSVPLAAQMVSVPVTHEVYPFLKRMQAKHLLPDYRDAMKPLSRMYLAGQIRNLDSLAGRMTGVERATFEFLKTEFQYEIGKLSGDPEPTETRWHLFSTELTGGVLNFDVNYRYSFGQYGNDVQRYRGQGIKMQGYLFDDIGYYFNWIDSFESGDGLNFGKTNTPDPGVVPTNIGPKLLNYDDIDAQVSFRVGKVELSLEKMKNNWGFGERGQIILSSKAPSYPQIKIRVPLSNNIDFVYFHGELNSNIVDSSRSYYTHTSGLVDYYRPVDHLKFLVAHQLEFTVIDGLNLSLGESAVYSDRGPLLIYLIPIVFFKAAEHYNGDKDNDQIFGSADVSLLSGFNFYCTLFIDDLNTDNLFDPAKSVRQVGVTAGIHTYDKLLDNLEIIAEYTRLNPWVYEHYYGTTDYRNNGYVLGDWIGQNADDLYFDVSYRPLRQLQFGAFSEVYRKGGMEDISNMLSPGEPPFLYGPLHQERSFGLHGKYQPLRDLFIDFRGRTVKIVDEALGTNKSQLEFVLGVQLGVW
ncbi:MAG TPA: capsule assembly Wzi family protein [Bacteroidota bacterium]|nr:capsule assembly Wzi family protein [Bacteroidota bacterium]